MSRHVLVWMIAAMSLPGWVSSNSQPPLRSRFVLTEQQVAQAISAKGVYIAENQVSLLANVVATEPGPAIDVMSVQPLGEIGAAERTESRSIVKLACHQSGVCLPFYAIIVQPNASSPDSIGKRGGGAARMASALLKPESAIVMRAGTHAMLEMNDDRSHIQVSVISLENGAVGHKIRVASPDHKQVYVAEVVDAHMLKRNF